ncbi:MAG: response regulator transcription factor [Marinilabiliaceae bacterium]|nr:response regulator transcription factor [Marinilabiliaceae bacterium]
MIHVGLYNDQKLVLDCLEKYLNDYSGLTIVLKTNEKDNLISHLKKKLVHILLIGIQEISISDLNMIIQINMKYPKIKILVLSSIIHESLIFKIVKSGASGIISPNSNAENLVEAIYTLRNGFDYFDNSITHLLLKQYIEKLNKEHLDYRYDNVLSARQIEIIKLWGNGYSNHDIAEKLFISVRTVETHKNQIMNKLNLKNNVDLIKYAIKNNIIQL